MKQLSALMGICLSLALSAAYATEAAKEPAAAPEVAAKPADGASAAKPAASGKQTAQREKMKACNKEAGDKKLKGAERKAFMKECLSAK